MKRGSESPAVETSMRMAIVWQSGDRRGIEGQKGLIRGSFVAHSWLIGRAHSEPIRSSLGAHSEGSFGALICGSWSRIRRSFGAPDRVPSLRQSRTASRISTDVYPAMRISDGDEPAAFCSGAVKPATRISEAPYPASLMSVAAYSPAFSSDSLNPTCAAGESSWSHSQPALKDGVGLTGGVSVGASLAAHWGRIGAVY